MIMLQRQKLLKVYLSIFFLFVVLLFSGCDLASGGKSYKRVTIDKEDEKHIYSCEENFNDISIEIQAKKSDEYLFNKIEESSEKLVHSMFDRLEKESKESKEDESSSTWSEFFREVSFVFDYTSESLEMQGNIKKEVEYIKEKFGCILIETIEE